jgi:hypothetical protein
MLPVQSAAGTLTAISLGASDVPFTTDVIKGVQYAFFAASSGVYRATYS